MERRLMAKVDLPYVHVFRDRHGRERHYYRRSGRRVPLPGAPGSSEYMDAYQAAHEKLTPAPVEKAAPARSFRALALSYFQGQEFASLSSVTQRNYRRIIEAFCAEHGHRLVHQMTAAKVDSIMAKRAGTPAAANNMLKRLRALLKHARRLKWIDGDPTADTAFYRVGEYHTWTEEELAQFEGRWKPGTKQRLAYALHLYTGQRRSDVHRMTWADIEGDRIRVVQEKTGAKLSIPLHPTLKAELARAKREHVAIITTERGAAFTTAGYGNWFREARMKAQLPNRCGSHGLRKAAAARLANAGCTAHEIMAITGHTSLSEVERYTRASTQEHLADSALKKQVGNGEWQTPGKPSGKP